jgi:predicted RNA binding protein YcfA (HicA-like mRNA interferase family)
MGRKFPVLKPKDVVANLEGLGFKFKRQDGSHAQYERLADATKKRAVVTVDMAMSSGFSKDLTKSMIRQSLFDKEEFYSGTPKTQRLPKQLDAKAGKSGA